MKLTQRSPIANALAQEIPGTYGGELRISLHQALGLRTFAHPRGSNEDDAGSSFELFGGHRCARAKTLDSGGFTGKTRMDLEAGLGRTLPRPGRGRRSSEASAASYYRFMMMFG